MEEIIINICKIKPVTLKELSDILNRNPDGIRKKYISKMVKDEKIQMKYPNEPNHPQQSYFV